MVDTGRRARLLVSAPLETIALHLLQGRDPFREVGRVLLDQPRDSGARSLTAVPSREDLANLPESQTNGLCRPDEAKPSGRFLVVVANPEPVPDLYRRSERSRRVRGRQPKHLARVVEAARGAAS